MQHSHSKESLVYHDSIEDHIDIEQDPPMISYGSTDINNDPPKRGSGENFYTGGSQSMMSLRRQIYQDLGPKARHAGLREQRMERLASVRSASAASFENENHRPLQKVLGEMIFGKTINVLLLALPFAYLSHYLGWSSSSVFIWNFLAMIPLAALLGDFTEELAAHTNQTIGGLINASFGNAVEVVVSIQVRFCIF